MTVLIVETMMTKITMVGYIVMYSRNQSFEDGLSVINWGRLRF